MQDKAVFDSNVIAAVFFNEAISEKAEKYIEECNTCITLDLAIPEVSNVAWKKVKLFNESNETVQKSLEKCIEFITTVCQIIQSKDMALKAYKLALKRNITVYDALFIATSNELKISFITADKVLYDKIKDFKVIFIGKD